MATNPQREAFMCPQALIPQEDQGKMNQSAHWEYAVLSEVVKTNEKGIRFFQSGAFTEARRCFSHCLTTCRKLVHLQSCNDFEEHSDHVEHSLRCFSMSVAVDPSPPEKAADRQYFHRNGCLALWQQPIYLSLTSSLNIQSDDCSLITAIITFNTALTLHFMALHAGESESNPILMQLNGKKAATIYKLALQLSLTTELQHDLLWKKIIFSQMGCLYADLELNRESTQCFWNLFHIGIHPTREKQTTSQTPILFINVMNDDRSCPMSTFDSHEGVSRNELASLQDVLYNNATYTLFGFHPMSCAAPSA